VVGLRESCRDNRFCSGCFAPSGWVRRLSVLACVASITVTLCGTVLQNDVAEAAASTWSMTRGDNQTNAAELNAVSCTSSSFCEAVGNYTNSSGVTQNLIETWNGASWAIATSPDNGSGDNYLLAVSCTSSNSCETVGYYATSSGHTRNLIEIWNGTSWAVATSPDKGLSPELNGVSCTTLTFCEAVGSYTDSSGVTQNLIETWYGTSWTIATSPDKGTLDNSLSWVSCKKQSFCETVGNYTNPSVEPRNLIETWNGTSWAVSKSPNEKDTLADFLSGVSCTRLSFCEAVGTYETDSQVGQNVIEVWNGTSWAITTSPQKGPNTLSAVSCTNSSFCEAVGFFENSSEVTQSLIEVWNGTSWQIQPSP